MSVAGWSMCDVFVILTLFLQITVCYAKLEGTFIKVYVTEEMTGIDGIFNVQTATICHHSETNEMNVIEIPYFLD